MTGAACFGCGAQDGLQEVGDTVFCRACLGRMLRRVDERAESAGGAGGRARRGVERGETGDGDPDGSAGGAGGRAPRGINRSRMDLAPLVGTPTADAPCFLCGEPLDGDGFVELRGFAICTRCSRSLLGEPAADEAGSGDPPIDSRSFPAGGAGDPAAPADRPGGEADVQRPAAAAPIWTPGSGTEWCSRCGRPMPGPGSYVLIDGRPHCAACAAARMHDGLRRGDAPGVEGCDACDRALGPGPVVETDGFRLCAACLHSDRDLAVALARSRHQRRLARASRRVLDGEDD